MALNCFKAIMGRNIRYMIYLIKVSKQVKTVYIQNTFRKYLLSAVQSSVLGAGDTTTIKIKALLSRI